MQWVTLVLQWLGSSPDDRVACGPCQHVSCGRLSFPESFSGDPEARRCWHHVPPLRILNAFSLAEWVWVTMHFSKNVADFPVPLVPGVLDKQLSRCWCWRTQPMGLHNPVLLGPRRPLETEWLSESVLITGTRLHVACDSDCCGVDWVCYSKRWVCAYTYVHGFYTSVYMYTCPCMLMFRVCSVHGACVCI